MRGSGLWGAGIVPGGECGEITLGHPSGTDIEWQSRGNSSITHIGPRSRMPLPASSIGALASTPRCSLRDPPTAVLRTLFTRQTILSTIYWGGHWAFDM